MPFHRKPNIRIGRISRWLTPGYSWCYRCLTTWYFVEDHATPYQDNHACFPLCKKCWQQLAPEQRLPYYRQLWDEWRDDDRRLGLDTQQDDLEWLDIAHAVLKGK